MKRNEDIKTDETLRRILKTGMPQAPASPWFTRKVLNRLPDRQRHRAAWIETAVYLAGLVITTVYGVKFISLMWDEDELTLNDAAIYGVIFALFAMLLYALLEPWFCRVDTAGLQRRNGMARRQ